MAKECEICGKEISDDRDVCEECVEKVLKQAEEQKEVNRK